MEFLAHIFTRKESTFLIKTKQMEIDLAWFEISKHLGINERYCRKLYKYKGARFINPYDIVNEI